MRTAAMDDYFFNEIKSHPSDTPCKPLAGDVFCPLNTLQASRTRVRAHGCPGKCVSPNKIKGVKK